MSLSVPVTWSEHHRLHAPETAVWVGLPIPADELPARVDLIRAELEDAGASVVDAERHADDALLGFLPGTILAFADAQRINLIVCRLGIFGPNRPRRMELSGSATSA